MIRKPYAAGQFYPMSASQLTEQVNEYIDTGAARQNVTGAVCPHAGLVYSGSVAGAVYSRIECPGTFILLGPNHTGFGSPVSLMPSGEWQMPTGTVEIDEGLARKIMDGAGIIEEDIMAHQMEHSLEVQLPFIINQCPGAHIVPITMMTDSLQACETIGKALAGVIRNAEYPVTIIASSDMSHCQNVSDAEIRSKDRMAIDEMLDMSPEGLYRTVRSEAITMCGVIPATTMLFAALELGASEAALVKYMNSAEVSGSYDYVVGYAGIIVT